VTGLDAETRTMVAQTLERFMADRYDPAKRLARLNSGEVDYRRNWPLLAELGVLGLPVAAEDGGMGAGAADLSGALQVLARGLILEPVADALVATALLASARDDNSAQSLELAVSGDRIWLMVGLPFAQERLRVETVDGETRLNGAVRAVPFAMQADEWLVAAQDGQGQTRLLSIPVKQAGVRISTFRLMDGRPACDLHFEAIKLDATCTWWQPGQASKALARAGDLRLMALVADAVGVMDHVLGMTRDYLRTRIQFGVAIGSFQALQHRLADMQMEFLEARALLQSWTQALDEGKDAAALARLRRALPRVATRAGRRIGQEAIQMHGGMGVTEELVISHCNARLQVTGSLLQPWIQAANENVDTETA
jgi:alkylation response protein AidB-like acyl-CoA dehydrogenase